MNCKWKNDSTCTKLPIFSKINGAHLHHEIGTLIQAWVKMGIIYALVSHHNYFTVPTKCKCMTVTACDAKLKIVSIT